MAIGGCWRLWYGHGKEESMAWKIDAVNRGMKNEIEKGAIKTCSVRHGIS